MSASRSLVIGGTGMLSDATSWLADRSELTVLVARRASQYAGNDKRFFACNFDWDDAGFLSDVCEVISAKEPIERALLWLRQPEKLIGPLLSRLDTAMVVHVLGSGDGAPAISAAKANLVTVRLGSMATSTGARRWLTNKEISDGAIAAFDDGKSRIVGQPKPV